MPGYNADFTAMRGGTIVQGVLPVSTGADYFTVRDLGVDAGSAYVDSNLNGSPSDALAIYNSSQVLGGPPVQSPLIKNVSCLGYSTLAPVHCMLIENVHNATVRNVTTVMNQHGLVLKGTNSTVDGVHARGHGIDSIIVKSDSYAPVSNDSLTNISIAPLIASGDTEGIYIQGEGAPLSNTNISNVNIQSPLAWGIVIQGASSSATVGGISLSNITVDYPGGSPAGIYCMVFVQYVLVVNVQNLTCSNIWAGIAPYDVVSGAFDNFSVSNSDFTNIATNAIESYGSWTVTDSTFTGIGGDGILNIGGVATVSGNVFTNIGGSNMSSNGGTFVQGP